MFGRKTEVVIVNHTMSNTHTAQTTSWDRFVSTSSSMTEYAWVSEYCKKQAEREQTVVPLAILKQLLCM